MSPEGDTFQHDLMCRPPGFSLDGQSTGGLRHRQVMYRPPGCQAVRLSDFRRLVRAPASKKQRLAALQPAVCSGVFESGFESGSGSSFGPDFSRHVGFR